MCFTSVGDIRSLVLYERSYPTHYHNFTTESYSKEAERPKLRNGSQGGKLEPDACKREASFCQIESITRLMRSSETTPKTAHGLEANTEGEWLLTQASIPDPKDSSWAQNACGIPGTNLFPESIPSEWLVIFWRLLFYNFVGFVHGCVVVLGTLSQLILATKKNLNLLETTKVLPKSAKDLPRLNKIKKINQRIGKHKTESATCRNESRNAEPKNWEGGGVTSHGVFNTNRGTMESNEWVYSI